MQHRLDTNSVSCVHARIVNYNNSCHVCVYNQRYITDAGENLATNDLTRM